MPMQEIKKVLLLTALLAGTATIFLSQDLSLAQIEDRVRDQGPWSAIAFVFIYAMSVVLFVPGAIITLAGGAIFGPALGFFLNLSGATLGAILCFYIGRYLGAEFVEKKARGSVRRIVSGIEKEGWKFLAFVRLVPLFPFNIVNYAMGMTKTPFWPYLVTSFFGIMPAGFAYTYLGHLGKEASEGNQSLIETALYAVSLLAVALYLSHLARRRKATRTSESSPSIP